MSTHSSATELAIVHPDAAGIDFCAQFHVVAVSAERDDQPVRSFRSFNQHLHVMTNWLKQAGIPMVEMESTGGTGFPLTKFWRRMGLKFFGQRPGGEECSWVQDQCERCPVATEAVSVWAVTGQFPATPGSNSTPFSLQIANMQISLLRENTSSVEITDAALLQ